MDVFPQLTHPSNGEVTASDAGVTGCDGRVNQFRGQFSAVLQGTVDSDHRAVDVNRDVNHFDRGAEDFDRSLNDLDGHIAASRGGLTC